MVTATEELIDFKRSWEDQTRRVLETLRTAHNLGRISDSSALTELSQLAVQDPTRVLRSFLDASDAVKQTLSLTEKLAIVACRIPNDVAVVHRFVIRAEEAILSIERNLAVRQREVGGATDLEEATTRVLASTNRFDEAVRRLAP
ncbi:hypothetical protein MYP14_23420 [Rhodococcus pyridinivorans]|uniref:hypothetical protein n=1 Tax=Rhodococcus pyridinivorans TaxID=103816 RepID=UPI001FFFA5B3|nr:hypothetical protein [Rhodococcus pyridinivorans]UPK63610.1 hypothetical protein MYP14_23420 [Rhodococcus pyridinivorans]